MINNISVYRFDGETVVHGKYPLCLFRDHAKNAKNFVPRILTELFSESAQALKQRLVVILQKITSVWKAAGSFPDVGVALIVPKSIRSFSVDLPGKTGITAVYPFLSCQQNFLDNLCCITRLAIVLVFTIHRITYPKSSPVFSFENSQ